MAKARSASIRHLQIFCMAARLMSFKRAAASLNLTPSAVSHRIRELEGNLGLELFERRTRGLELTQAGQDLFQRVAPLLEAVDHSVREIAREPRRRRLRVTAPQFFASEMLVPRLPGFGARWPLIDLRLDSTLPKPTEHAADADASILISTDPPAGLWGHALAPLLFAAMCSPGCRAALGPLERGLPADVALLTHRHWPDAWSGWSAASGLAIPATAQVVEFDTTFSLLRAAQNGLGLALVPTHLAATWIGPASLVRIDGCELASGEHYWFVLRPDDLARSEVRAFRDWTLTEFGRG